MMSMLKKIVLFPISYANLRSSPGVGEGQYVSAGEVIGAVGSSSIAEFSMPAHLHFSVSKDEIGRASCRERV